MFIAAFSIAGPRADNQDTVFYQSRGTGSAVALVADGVGGMGGGKAASMCVLTAAKIQMDKQISDPSAILRYAHELVQGLEMPTAATTASVVSVDNRRLYFAHTGDSRICILRGSGLKTLTSDQTETEQLIREGVLNRQSAKTYHRKNVLTHAIEKGQDLNLEAGTFDIEVGDRILLITDGIYKLLDKIALRDLSLVHPSAELFCRALENLIRPQAVDDSSMVVLDVD